MTTDLERIRTAAHNVISSWVHDRDVPLKGPLADAVHLLNVELLAPASPQPVTDDTKLRRLREFVRYEANVTRNLDGSYSYDEGCATPGVVISEIDRLLAEGKAEGQAETLPWDSMGKTYVRVSNAPTDKPDLPVARTCD